MLPPGFPAEDMRKVRAMSDRHPSPHSPGLQVATHLLASLDELIERISEQLEEIERVALTR